MNVTSVSFRDGLKALSETPLPAFNPVLSVKDNGDQEAEAELPPIIELRCADGQRDPIILTPKAGESHSDTLNRYFSEWRMNKHIDAVDLTHRIWPDLRDVDISDMDMAYGRFVDVSLEEVRADNTILSHSIMKRVHAIGFRSEQGLRATGMQITDSNWNYTVIKNGHLRGLNGKGVKALNCDWEGSVLSQARLEDFDFGNSNTSEQDGANLKNIDWGGAIASNLKLHDADLSDTTYNDAVDSLNNLNLGSGTRLQKKDFPNKMRGTIFHSVEKSKHTRLNEMNKGSVILDSIVQYAGKSAAIGAVGGAVMLSDAVLGTRIIDTTTQLFNDAGMSKLGVVVAVPLVSMAMNKAWDTISNLCQKAAQSAFASFFSESKHKFKAFAKKMSVLITDRKNANSFTTIVKALETTKKKRPSKWKSVCSYLLTDDHAIVLCDERHLAEALGHICANRKSRYQVQNTVTLVRNKADGEPEIGAAPNVVTFHKDGSTSVSWVKDDRPFLILEFDDTGALTRKIDARDTAFKDLPADQIIPGVSDNLSDLVNMFEGQILKDSHLRKFDYDRATSYVVAGENGSLQVRDGRTRQLHNEKGPALITYRDGRLDGSCFKDFFFFDKDEGAISEARFKELTKERSVEKQEAMDAFCPKVRVSLSDMHAKLKDQSSRKEVERLLRRLMDFKGIDKHNFAAARASYTSMGSMYQWLSNIRPHSEENALSSNAARSENIDQENIENKSSENFSMKM